MRKEKTVALLAAVLFLVVLGLQFILREQKIIEVEPVVSTCVPVEQLCSVTFNGKNLFFSIPGKPSALKPFPVELTDKERGLESVTVRFKMKRMEMGFNQFVFEQLPGSDRWLTEAVLPVCTAGRSDWVVELNVISGAMKGRFIFEFNL